MCVTTEDENWHIRMKGSDCSENDIEVSTFTSNCHVSSENEEIWSFSDGIEKPRLFHEVSRGLDESSVRVRTESIEHSKGGDIPTLFRLEFGISISNGLHPRVVNSDIGITGQVSTFPSVFLMYTLPDIIRHVVFVELVITDSENIIVELRYPFVNLIGSLGG